MFFFLPSFRERGERCAAISISSDHMWDALWEGEDVETRWRLKSQFCSDLPFRPSPHSPKKSSLATVTYVVPWFYVGSLSAAPRRTVGCAGARVGGWTANRHRTGDRNGDSLLWLGDFSIKKLMWNMTWSHRARRMDSGLKSYKASVFHYRFISTCNHLEIKIFPIISNSMRNATVQDHHMCTPTIHSPFITYCILHTHARLLWLANSVRPIWDVCISADNDIRQK